MDNEAGEVQYEQYVLDIEGFRVVGFDIDFEGRELSYDDLIVYLPEDFREYELVAWIEVLREKGVQIERGLLVELGLVNEDLCAVFSDEEMRLRQAVVDGDLVQAHKIESCEHELLSKEDGEALGKRIRDGVGVEEAVWELFFHNTRLLFSIVNQFPRGGDMNLLDWVQEGNYLLEKAARTFDVEKGILFSSYATWVIRRGLWRKQYEMIRRRDVVPVNMLKEYYGKYRSVIDECWGKLGRNPTEYEIAQACELKEERVKTVLLALKISLELDAPVDPSRGDGLTVGDRLVSKKFLPADTILAEKQRREFLLGFINDYCTPKQVEALMWRMGFMDGDERSFEDIGGLMGCSKQNAWDLVGQGLGNLHKNGASEVLSEWNWVG